MTLFGVAANLYTSKTGSVKKEKEVPFQISLTKIVTGRVLRPEFC